MSHANRVRVSDYVFGFGPAGAYGPPQDVYLYAYRDRTDYNVVTSDLSLAGDFDLFHRTSEFFAALEYQDTKTNHYNYTTFGLGLMNMFEDGGKGILADGSPIPEVPAPVYVGDQYSRNKQVRGSVQVLLHPLERVDVLAGLLVQHTDQTEDNIRVSKAVHHREPAGDGCREAAGYHLCAARHEGRGAQRCQGLCQLLGRRQPQRGNFRYRRQGTDRAAEDEILRVRG